MVANIEITGMINKYENTYIEKQKIRVKADWVSWGRTLNVLKVCPIENNTNLKSMFV